MFPPQKYEKKRLKIFKWVGFFPIYNTITYQAITNNTVELTYEIIADKNEHLSISIEVAESKVNLQETNIRKFEFKLTKEELIERGLHV